jgi:ABC-type transport system substrate-binding protein
MTARDVLATFGRIKAKVEGGWLTSALAGAGRREALDDRTFTIRLAAPFAPFLNVIAAAWILSPASPGWNDRISLHVGRAEPGALGRRAGSRA